MKVSVQHNDRSQIIIAAGPVTMTGKQLLTVTDIPKAELDVVRLAWVRVGPHDETVPTATDAVHLLTNTGPALAVITGPAGYGKRTAGIRALWEVARAERTSDKSLELKEIQPDWVDPSAPDISTLPDNPGTGYLLDVASEIGSWTNRDRAANSLVSHAEKLRNRGSYLVVIVDEHEWPESESSSLSRVVVSAKVKPSPHGVAQAHLRHIHRKPEREHWLNTTPSSAGGIGEASRLLTESSSPADAARLASILASVDESREGLETAKARFQQWKKQVTDVFKNTEDNADDRALLIASLFLSGEDALNIQRAARMLLNEPQDRKVRAILTGPDLTTRFEGVGAKIAGRQVTLDHRPGYARAILLHLWHQRPDIHTHLLTWLDAITASGQPGAARLGPISELLVQLAMAENDIRVVEQIQAWVDNGNDRNEHRDLIARVLTTAAKADALGPAVRARLLDWAQDRSTSVATVVALVCRGEFADHFPRQALVRLRHILDRTNRDLAVETAEGALRSIAAREGQLPRVWATVIKWATEHHHLAGHRAFLSLLDPQVDPFVLQVLMAAAEQKSDVKDALISGWNAALVDPRVNAESKALLTAWAHARADGTVPRDLITDILKQVVARHMLTTPIAALVAGEPGVAYDEAVIDLRKELQMGMGLAISPIGEPPREK
ncbi:hypothetical protein [Streptomyces orinoci]|uniref:Uncharacterized protein n=1 Tax=Streptomyces orinoci TaxID=67339 RepID=A0ABV3K253_STRON|nr:hypothetical protein [Streptomyces orinoci]